MKYKKVNGKLMLVKDNGEVTNTEVSQEVVDATGAEEVVDNTLAEGSDELEKVEEEIKTFVGNTVKSEVANAVKSLNSIKGISSEVKNAIRDGLTGGETKAKFYTEDGKKELTAQEVLAGLKSATQSSGKAFSFSVDNVKTLSELGSLTGNVILEDRLPGITREPVRPVFVEQLCNVSATGSDKVTYVEAVSETGAPATTAELAKFPEKDWEFAVFQADVKKIAVMHKASNEILEDAPQLVSKVREWLNEDMNITAEDKILFGSGLVNEFTGIFTVAPTFAPTITGVQSPNEFDVLRIAIQQIVNSSKMRYMPNAILMNPEDAAKLDLVKNTQDSYILPPFTTSDHSVIKGVTIVENPAIPAGEFLVGDFKKANIANRRGLSMQVATENSDDFEKDMITIRLSRRFAFYVRNNDLGAFVKGDFATGLTAIA